MMDGKQNKNKNDFSSSIFYIDLMIINQSINQSINKRIRKTKTNIPKGCHRYILSAHLSAEKQHKTTNTEESSIWMIHDLQCNKH